MSRYPHRRNPKTGKLSYLHRAMAEFAIGRPLAPGKVVDHDENRGDAHPKNLVTLANQSAHMRLHWHRPREAKGVQRLFGLDEWLELHK